MTLRPALVLALLALAPGAAPVAAQPAPTPAWPPHAPINASDDLDRPPLRVPPVPVDDRPRPRPLDAGAADAVAALDRVIAQGAPGDPAVVLARFRRAHTRLRFDQVDLALPELVLLLERHRDHVEIAEYSANLLLDTLNRQRRYDAMLRWVRALRADARFVADHEELAERLRLIEARWLELTVARVEAAVGVGGTGLPWLALVVGWRVHDGLGRALRPWR